MQQRPTEVIIAQSLFMVFWVLTVAVILIAGRRWQRARSFREKTMAQWKPSLTIAVLFVVGTGLGGRGFFNPYAIAVFCQSLIGLALARSIADYEPLPVVRSISCRERVLRSVGLMLGVALLLVLAALLIGSVGMGVAQQIFGEVARTEEAMGMFPSNKAQIFFLFLAGAGIAEETIYRLVCVSFLWRLTRRRGLAIFLSALVFVAYHLSPLDSLYQVFWQYPLSQFLSTTLIGLVWGYVYVKRGYETAVLTHTLSNWIPFLFFSG
jgi:membrane protease YdiL (CAAX protease family)